MIRTLILIAAASFVLAFVCFAGAFAAGGSDLFMHGWPGPGWARHEGPWGPVGPAAWRGDGGPTVTREIDWTGGQSLDLDLPADVHFTQAPGPAKLVVTGPQGLVEQLTLDGSRLDSFRWCAGWCMGRLNIVMTAPDISRFSINGDDRLTITSYNQDDLEIDVSGHGQVTADGKAQSEHVHVSGAGDVDLGRVNATSAEVDISGVSHSVVAPTQSADVRISGAGAVDLMTRPADLRTDISGAGRINQMGPAAATSQPQ